ncbi:MAG TPA: PAS domain S-box protein, partial [Chitinophagales bacterium]
MTELLTNTISEQELQNVFGSLANDYVLLKNLNLKDEDLRWYFEENSNKPTVVISKATGYLFINKAYEKFSGFTPEEIIGKPISDYTQQPKELLKKRMNDR